MKKYLIWAFGFLIWGLAVGVFFREFTKFNDLNHIYTPLGLVHPHVLILGTVMTVLIGLVNTKLNVGKDKIDRAAFYCYVGGVIGASIMLLVRGILDVLTKIAGSTFAVSGGIDGMISGLSGAFHIVLAIAIVFIFARWIWNKKLAKNRVEENTVASV